MAQMARIVGERSAPLGLADLQRSRCKPDVAAGLKLSNNLDGNQFGAATGVLDGFNRVFGSEPSHSQGQFAVGSSLDGSAVDALHILRRARAGAVDSYKELGVCHVSPFQA